MSSQQACRKRGLFVILISIVNVASGYRIQRRANDAIDNQVDQGIREQLEISENNLKKDAVAHRALDAFQEKLKDDPTLSDKTEEYTNLVRRGMAAFLTMNNQTSAFNMALRRATVPLSRASAQHDSDASQRKGEHPVWQQEMMSKIATSTDGSAMRSAIVMLAKSPKKRSDFCYGLVGAMPPAGEWDPAGFGKRVSEEEMKKFREAELTHGRLSMLAAAGFLTQEGFHPLFTGTNAAAGDLLPTFPSGLYFGLGLTITVCEGARLYYKSYFESEDTIPGDYGFDPLGLKPDAPAALERIQLVELANSRLAMLAAAGFIAQESVSGTTWSEWWALNAAPPSLLQVSDTTETVPAGAFNLGALSTKSSASKVHASPLAASSLVKVQSQPVELPTYQQNLIHQVASAKGGLAERASVYMAAKGSKKSDFCYGLPGSIPPAGEFDPLGFSSGGATEKQVLTYREAELVHGRIAMMASLGYIVQENYHPLFDQQTGPADVLLSSLPPWIFFAVTIGVGLCEFSRAPAVFGSTETVRKVGPAPKKGKAKGAAPARLPGDLGFDPLALKPSDPDLLRERQEQELSHGRLAMLASMGFVVQEGVSGATWSDYWGGLGN